MHRARRPAAPALSEPGAPRPAGRGGAAVRSDRGGRRAGRLAPGQGRSRCCPAATSCSSPRRPARSTTSGSGGYVANLRGARLTRFRMRAELRLRDRGAGSTAGDRSGRAARRSGLGRATGTAAPSSYAPADVRRDRRLPQVDAGAVTPARRRSGFEARGRDRTAPACSRRSSACARSRPAARARSADARTGSSSPAGSPASGPARCPSDRVLRVSASRIDSRCTCVSTTTPSAMPVRGAQHDVRGLARDARQGRQLRQRRRHLAAEALDQRRAPCP